MSRLREALEHCANGIAHARELGRDWSPEQRQAYLNGLELVARKALEPADDRTHDDDGEPICSNPGGHEFECTGTQYGGDDERWGGEGRSLCIHCGADGDA